jgi:hypothetical protein
MKLFQCQFCGQLVYFENRICEGCGHTLGYLPDNATMSAMEPDGSDWWALAEPESRYRFCFNAQYDVCNWLVAADATEPFCLACRHNQTIPDLSLPDNLLRWRKLEVAKHRLFYSLLRLGLPLVNRIEDPEQGLAFDFVAEPRTPDAEPVMTGHDNGLITLSLKEADDSERERTREDMNESYRTLLGHFRHEIGHYYWDRLVAEKGRLDEFRACFGDERQDYGEALKRHYAEGPPVNWQNTYVSAYATAHPWEDFAETWAHYLHIVDSLETAGAFGLQVHPRIDKTGDFHTEVNFDPHHARSISQLVDAWLPVTFAVNSLNRSMGHPDLYPFILSPTVIEKLGKIHGVVHGK